MVSKINFDDRTANERDTGFKLQDRFLQFNT